MPGGISGCILSKTPGWILEGIQAVSSYLPMENIKRVNSSLCEFSNDSRFGSSSLLSRLFSQLPFAHSSTDKRMKLSINELQFSQGSTRLSFFFSSLLFPSPCPSARRHCFISIENDPNLRRVIREKALANNGYCCMASSMMGKRCWWIPPLLRQSESSFHHRPSTAPRRTSCIIIIAPSSVTSFTPAACYTVYSDGRRFKNSSLKCSTKNNKITTGKLVFY